jgi:hypothetical protein
MIDLETSSETTERNNTLFEEIFGYKKGALTNVSVAKHFRKDITAKLKLYSLLLEKSGFVESGNLQWTKADLDNNRLYIWGYTAAKLVAGIGTSQSAVWTVTLTDISEL